MEEIFGVFGSIGRQLSIAILVSFYVIFVFVMMNNIRRRKDSKSLLEETFSNLMTSIDKLEEDDIYLQYKKKIQSKSGVRDYIDFLERFSIFVMDKSKENENWKEINSKIKVILEKEKKEKPFCNLLDRERRILLSIEDAASKNETNVLNNHLQDLSIVIENNQRDLDNSKMINMWSLPISIIGVILTLYIWLCGSSISDNDIKKISNEVVTQINSVPQDSLKTK